jgi:hypothetical protein
MPTNCAVCHWRVASVKFDHGRGYRPTHKPPEGQCHRRHLTDGERVPATTGNTPVAHMRQHNSNPDNTFRIVSPKTRCRDRNQSTTQCCTDRTTHDRLMSPVAQRVAPDVAMQLQPPQRLPLSVAKNAKRDTMRRRRDMTNKLTAKAGGPPIGDSGQWAVGSGRTNPPLSPFAKIRVIRGSLPVLSINQRLAPPHSAPNPFR